MGKAEPADPSTLGGRMKWLRDRAGLTQVQAAKEMGIEQYGQATVSRWERGVEPPTGPEADAWVRIMGGTEEDRSFLYSQILRRPVVPAPEQVAV
jgi:transcriptional regulator with XRE-family HTH domain